jgi:hypothetical protein
LISSHPLCIYDRRRKSRRSSPWDEPTKEGSMAPSMVLVDDEVERQSKPQRETVAATPAFRLRPMMRQGTASSIPETWIRFSTLDDARKAVKQMYHDDRVLRVFIVSDEAPPRFVEWVER